MRKFIAALLAFCLIFTLCSCSKKDTKDDERDCGLFITMEADDVYVLSCGCEDGSGSVSGADEDEPLTAGEVYHFDFAGKAAENTKKAVIDYSICIYDKNLDIIADASFSDDFSNMAKINITVTKDHRILNSNSSSCGGDIIVTTSTVKPEDNISIQKADVKIPLREEAQTAIMDKLNELNDEFISAEYNMPNNADASLTTARTLRVQKADSAVLSFRVVDRVNIGTESSLKITGVNFNAQTGEVLSISDLTDDLDTFSDRCAEEILISTTDGSSLTASTITFTDGYTDTIKKLISDGHWYLNTEGIVVIANPGEIAALDQGFFEFVVPFDEVSDYLKNDFLPADLHGDDGDVKITLSKDAKLKDISSVGFEDGNICASVQGNIYEISAYSINYNAASGSIVPVSQLFYCSDLSDGALISIAHELETNPNLMLSFIRPDENLERRLVSINADGEIVVVDPDGGEGGFLITEKLPYSVDLDGDSKSEKIDISYGDSGSAVLSVESGSNSFTEATGITELISVRLFDLDGNGKREIFIDGYNANGTAVTYAYRFSEKLSTFVFDTADYGKGSVKEFTDGKIVLLNSMDILGTYSVNEAYSLNGGKFVKDGGNIILESGGKFVTTTKQITLSDGSFLAANTILRFTSTDGTSIINFVTNQGITGSFSIAKSDSGWTIGGQPDTSYFASLPYSG